MHDHRYTDALFLGRRYISPILIVELLIPSDSGLTLLNTLYQPHGVDDLRARLTAFVPGGAEGVIFARSNGILQAELDRVEVHRTCDLFHVTIERPIALWHAVPAIRTGRRRVGVDDVRVETDVGRLAILTIAHVQRHGLVAGVAGHCQGVGAVCAGV